MIEQDTIRLLRECDAGVKMGVSSIDEVLGYVHADAFKKYLSDCKQEHEKLGTEMQGLLNRYKQGSQSHCKGDVLDKNQHEAGYG